jgi:hypothetical protein
LLVNGPSGPIARFSQATNRQQATRLTGALDPGAFRRSSRRATTSITILSQLRFVRQLRKNCSLFSIAAPDPNLYRRRSPNASIEF